VTASLLHGGRDVLQRLFEEVVEQFESAFPYLPKDEHLGSFVDEIIADATTAE